MDASINSIDSLLREGTVSANNQLVTLLEQQGLPVTGDYSRGAADILFRKAVFDIEALHLCGWITVDPPAVFSLLPVQEKVASERLDVLLLFGRVMLQNLLQLLLILV